MESNNKIPSEIQDEIKSTFSYLSALCHGNSFDAGWWFDLHYDRLADMADPSVQASKIALIHSEVSEALEHLRRGTNDDKLTHRNGVEVELVDVIVRVFDLAGAYGYDLGGALIEKMAYNNVRLDHAIENRRKPGGKRF